jgi:FtsH-binding integral membrane protein
MIAWLWILLGFISGAWLGLNFHREDWLGGYASHRRRLYRLGHISFFGLAAINLLFVFTLQPLADQQSVGAGMVHTASIAFVAGTITMPLCCAVAAHQRDVRALFAIPVTSLIVGGICTFWEVVNL